MVAALRLDSAACDRGSPGSIVRLIRSRDRRGHIALSDRGRRRRRRAGELVFPVIAAVQRHSRGDRLATRILRRELPIRGVTANRVTRHDAVIRGGVLERAAGGGRGARAVRYSAPGW